MSADGKTAFAADNTSGAESAKANGQDSTSLGYGSDASGEKSTATGHSAKATGKNSTANGNGAKATGTNSTAVGQNAQATAENSVALGQGSIANEINTVSVGSVGKERRVTNVADPVKGTDAVNKRYVDNSINAVRKDLRKADKKLRGGIAGATAIANIPQVTQTGANLVGVGVGSYNGQSAVAVGYSKLSDNNKVIIKFSGAATTQGDYNFGAGVGYQWK
ncbi:adhesin [Pasteurellaceae bacterium RH1A]|nr:adhesin [Pasteurellaceae bacterium RH1A]